MEDYSKQVLRVVVAQVCQAIGWHTIQSTPLELLTDILHKYMQELSVRTFRYTQLYSRTEANLDDVGLAFRDVGINVPDLLDYINNVDSVPCAVDVPRYPQKKESNLNFLKPGSKEVITRPVHVHEHLPPIHPEKEDDCPSPQDQSTTVPNPVHASVDPSTVITDITNATANSVNIINNKTFKKPDINDPMNSNKKTRIVHEDEGRPTREISSVMMTSSGFISPAREGKLPDSKTPVIPEYKPPQPETLPQPTKVSSATAIPTETSGVSNLAEIKQEKKSKKQKNSSPGASVGEVKDQKKRDRHLAKFQKRRGDSLDVGKSPSKRTKLRERAKHPINAISTSALIGPTLELPAPLEPFPPVTLPADLTIKSETVPVTPANVSNFPSCALNIENPSIVSTVLSGVDIKPTPNMSDEIKLSSAPDKQKYNIFKKISAKKSREENVKGSAGSLPNNDLYSGFPTLPESTTIRRLPAMKFDSPPHTDPNIIVVDDDTPPRPSSPFELSGSQLLPFPSLPAGTTATSATVKTPYFDNSLMNIRQPSTVIEPAKKQQRKPRKNKQQVLVEQCTPLNLSNESTAIKDFPLSDNLPAPESSKPPRKRLNKVGRPSKRQNTKMGGLSANPSFPQAMALPSMNSDSLKQDLSPLNMFKGPNNQFLTGMHRYPYINAFHLLAGPGLIPSPSFMHPSGNPLLAFRNPFGYNELMGLRPPIRPPKIDEAKTVSPPPSIPLESNVYCNVPPLVPDSLKLQLSPALLSRGNKLASSSSITPPTNKDSLSSIKSVNNKMETQNFGTYHHTATPTAANKQTRVFDAPIEISDDEKSITKSDTEIEKPIDSPHTPKGRTNINMGSTCETTSSHNKSSNSFRASEIKPIVESSDEVDNLVETNIDEATINPREKSENEVNVLDIPIEITNPNTKGEKKREKEHKKGKRGKEGKIKKKKEKKDKTKSKEKADKRKEEKKEKDRSKKKKEKRKEKLRGQLCSGVTNLEKPTSNNSIAQLDSGLTANLPSSMVPKLTLKFGSPNSVASDESPETRKLSKSFNGGDESIDDGAINERRESSPELARISPLVTRPPKQKTSTTSVPSAVEGRVSALQDIENRHHLHQHNLWSESGSLEKRSEWPMNLKQWELDDSALKEFHYGSYISTISPAISITNKTKSDTKPSLPLNSSPLQIWNYSDIETANTPQSTTYHPNNLHLNDYCSPTHEVQSLESYIDVKNSVKIETTVIRPSYIDAEGNQVWICPACGKVDDGTPMIGCDGCDAWYHWVCVGIQVPPDENEDWYCRNCIIKKQEANYYDKKKKRKKKNKTN